MKVWIVTTSNCEGSSLDQMSIHLSRKDAIAGWNTLRKSLLNNARRMMTKTAFPKMYEKMTLNLKCTNPDKIDNYPHDTPIIKDFEVAK